MAFAVKGDGSTLDRIRRIGYVGGEVTRRCAHVARHVDARQRLERRMQALRYATLVHAAHPYLRAACTGRLHEVQRAFHAAELADLHGEAAQLGMLEGAVGLFRTGEGLVQAQRRVERALQGGQAGERVVAMPAMPKSPTFT